MDSFHRLKDTVFRYLSPKRSAPESHQHDSKRRRTFGPGTPSNKASGSHAYEPISEPQGKKAQAELYNRVNNKYLSPSDTNNPRKRAREDDNDEDSEGEIEYDEMDQDGQASSLCPGDSPSNITPNGEEDNENQDENEDEDEEDQDEDGAEEEGELDMDEEIDEETLARAKVEEYLARQAELVLRREAIEEVKQQGTWHPDEIFLFERLSLRSYEALIPEDWKIDFRTLPEEVFGRRNEKTLISSISTSNFAGVKSLQLLLGLGMRVKEKIQAGRNADDWITKEIKSYMKWSEMDGGYFKLRFIPVLTVVKGKPHHSTDRISKSITTQMEFLAKKHREHLALPKPRINDLGETELYSRQPPLLYGIIVAQAMTIFVTLDSSDPEAKIRHIAHFDFKEKDVDVWNGFALAIIVMVARNSLMSSKDEYEPDSESEEDVDL